MRQSAKGAIELMEKFKVLEVFGGTEGCEVNLYSIPKEVGLVVIGDTGELSQRIGELLSHFAVEVNEHNAKVLGKE